MNFEPGNSVKPKVILVVGPTASGKSKEAVRLAKEQSSQQAGEVISVDSRQVYRGLDIGTEKTSLEEMSGIPHHLIDIRAAHESYSAGDFVRDANQLIQDILARGNVPILAGGSHFYIDALLYGLPSIEQNDVLRGKLEKLSSDELYQEILAADPVRASQLDPANRRRLVRAVEIIRTNGSVPTREKNESPFAASYEIEWVIIDPPRDELRERIEARLEVALSNGLIEEVARVRDQVGDTRLNELGLEYRIIGEYLRGERAKESLLPALSSKLWQYARRQKAWLRKLKADRNRVP